MGISSLIDLKEWFFANVKGKGDGQLEFAPHWRLYLGDYGSKEISPASNTRVDDMDKSYAMLEQAIRAQDTDGNARFRIVTYAPGKPNNPTAETYFQLKTAHAPAQQPGIAGLPAGVGSVEQYVAERIESEKLKWKVQQLEEQMNAPGDKWERIMETVAGIQGIDKVLQTAILGLAAKFVPQAMPAIQAAMNGTPNAPTGEPDADDDDTDPTAAFQQNVMEAAATLGTDPVTMAKKLNQLVKSNPEMAKSLMQ